MNNLMVREVLREVFKRLEEEGLITKAELMRLLEEVGDE